MDLGNGQGAGIVATQDASQETTAFVRVPQNLVLSKDLVWEYARADADLKAVLEAMGALAKVRKGDMFPLYLICLFGVTAFAVGVLPPVAFFPTCMWSFVHRQPLTNVCQSSQGAIVLFLLVQVTASSPDIKARIGVPNPFREYVQFLPDEMSLPSRWTEAELACLWGTSLRNHIAVKQHSLQTLFDDLRSKTRHIDWCAKWWWSKDHGCLTLDDLKSVDSMFRSRAMDFGDQGQSLVPVMDMANHDHGDHSIALYEIDRVDGGAMLVLRDDRSVRRGYEVTIDYGSDRSASDLLHAYGFIEEGMSHAGSMFVSFPPNFTPFEADPLATAKYVGLELVPGAKFYVSPDDRVRFHSPFVYAMSVNEEDGLSWDVARTVDGETEFHFLFRGKPVQGATQLVAELRDSPLWDLFQWRAHAYLMILIEGLIEEFDALEARDMDEKVPQGVPTDSSVWKVCVKLRKLERTLLHTVRKDFDTRVCERDLVGEWRNVNISS